MKTFKIKLKLNNKQRTRLIKNASVSRFVYNLTLEMQETNYKNGGKFLSDCDIRKVITIRKKDDLAWLYNYNCDIVKQAVKDACKAYKMFFNKKAKKPKFKSAKLTKPSFYVDGWKLKIENEFQFIPYINPIFLSAKTKKRVSTLMPEIIKAYENTTKYIKTNILNDVISEAYMLHPAPSYKGRRLKIYFVSQTDSKPPKFTFQVNNKGLVHFSYERYLENKIREAFDFTGTPIILQFKNRGEDN